MPTIKEKTIIAFLVLCIFGVVAVSVMSLKNIPVANILKSTSKGTAYNKPKQNGDSPIIIKDSGSTNSNAFDITVNPDGSGLMNTLKHITKNEPASSQKLISRQNVPAKTLEYEKLRQAIATVPNLKFDASQCIKSVSFGSVTTITFNGETSSDISCGPQGALKDSYYDLLITVVKIENEAVCFNPKNTSYNCQSFRKEQQASKSTGVKE